MRTRTLQHTTGAVAERDRMGLIQIARLLHRLSTQSSLHRGTVAVPVPRSAARKPGQSCKDLTSQHAWPPLPTDEVFHV